MTRRTLEFAVIAFVALCLGIGGTAVVLALIPDAGSPPSIYDDFNWNSTANGYWHVHSTGGAADIAHSNLTLRGDSVELDKRFQTDPSVTVISAKLRASYFHKLGIGVATYHAGTAGLEIDSDGIKCGRGTDFGYRVDPVTTWITPPTNQWLYVEVTIANPYPTTAEQLAADQLPPEKLIRPTITCSAWDSHGKLLGTVVAKNPPPNTHYVAIDEAYMRTWDSANNYQIDWVYAGPVSGNPLGQKFKGA
jgi:hypothetical protein